MKIHEMTKKDFDELPSREWNENVGLFDCIVILPGKAKEVHDSGFRMMDFVGVNIDEPVCRLSGCSDVIHLDGIGGYGDMNILQGIPTMKPVKSWSIDCLPKSGLLRLWCNDYKLRVGAALSSFDIVAIKMPKK